MSIVPTCLRPAPRWIGKGVRSSVVQSLNTACRWAGPSWQGALRVLTTPVFRK